MLRWFTTIRARIMLALISIMCLFSLTLLLVVFFEKQAISETSSAQIDELVRKETGRIAQDVFLMCRSVHESLLSRLKSGMEVANEAVRQAGGLSLSPERVTWSAASEVSGQGAELSLPRMLVGSQWLGQTRERSAEVPLVDRLHTLAGGDVTVFQRMNERGDMLRVATTASDRNGARLTGTFVPASGADGVANEAIQSVLHGS
ncbi:MAG TPA: Cache 3/Cache 2 fusion domain-containing protein [Myxococcota bacterium]|nr:Cache 3/Cache 2 fusion domain-containing protein [Myxococcota bacterium]HRY96251.1 Cache 3/Cache 2 fusion domain-containing protein [Myxococcota bacterium]HSA20458.1 Cache 3/Cache 2 fusion domain-containing protein [Myxococcota bacterium]